MIFNSKRAQSAMEYLMTYGWAILIILIAIGALFYLGVFSPSVPNVCTGTAPIICSDLKATDVGATGDTVVLSLGASGTTTARIKSMTVNGVVNGSSNFPLPGPNTVACLLPSSTLISTTSPTSITLTCGTSGTPTLNLVKGNKFTGTTDIEYYLSGSTTSHTITTQFSGTVE